MSSPQTYMDSKPQVVSKEKPHMSIFTELDIDGGPSQRPPSAYIKDPRNICFDDIPEVRDSDVRNDTKNKERSGCACLMM
ncbi:4beac4e4-bbf6-4952-a877-e84a2622fd4a [Sclerotinia trifoliorum]|uniref:4beac4e4-bbf6-4952-a877-e84a2622fd4a n=1 Tax=Sclerotinia trifoliorum TaxID=28548 RepID=A0A8H2ZQZ0_9HELO|nr:4beac4e4-bbf6-4952-a877-e84a2622fd4a [Sclerotinia trifoliorum]